MTGILPDLRWQDLLDHVMLTAYIAEFAEWDNRPHLERIRRYTYLLAAGTGLGHDEANLVSVASMLHDIGKIALPASILRKTANLEPAEYKLAEQHTLEGARLLRGSASPILRAGEIMARTHHERWDGTGYPEGLRGEAIPASGRIVALADVFDALTTKRPYKAEMKVQVAFDLIKSSSGTLFAPNIVSLFVDRFDDFKSVLRTSDPAVLA